MLLKLFQAGHPVLANKAQKVSPEKLRDPKTQQLIDLMIDTLRDYPGVGLAAPQVGEDLQIIVIEDKKEYHEKVPKKLLSEQGREPVDLAVLVNPVLEIVDMTEKFYFEGCLSVDGYRAVVPRASRVVVNALDRTGKPVTVDASGWYARILQHEVDHLNGTLYVGRMVANSFISESMYSKDWNKAGFSLIKERFLR